MPDIDFTPVLRALAMALVPFVREALGDEGVAGLPTGVLTEDNFDPDDWGLLTDSNFSDQGLLTEGDFDPADWSLMRSDEFDYSEYDLVTTDSLTEAVEEAVDEALSKLSITRD